MVTAEYLAVGLAVAQPQHDPVFPDVFYRSPDDGLCAGVGYVAPPVGIEHDDVACAEVGSVGSLFIAEVEAYATDWSVLRSIAAEGKFIVDVAGCLLVGQSVVPDGGKAGVFLEFVAHFGEQLLVGDETHKPEIVGLLQC